jgi:hypothetical protein
MSEKTIKCQVCGMDKNFKSSVAQGGFHGFSRIFREKQFGFKSYKIV